MFLFVKRILSEKKQEGILVIQFICIEVYLCADSIL